MPPTNVALASVQFCRRVATCCMDAFSTESAGPWKQVSGFMPVCAGPMVVSGTSNAFHVLLPDRRL